MGLRTVLARGPATSIDQAIALMTAIDGALPASDGLRWFNHLYLQVTRAVQSALAESRRFGDATFLVRLDVVFANLYFAAAETGNEDPSGAPAAWRPLLEARAAVRHPIQFALAGMNAHINRDLPAGIVTAYRELGGSPTVPDARREDFERVNDVLEQVETDMKREFTTGWVGKVDALTAPLDDRVAMWNVRAAREAAWTNAQVLWTLQSAPALRDDFFDWLDRFTGFASRGLLTPLALASPVGQEACQ